MKRLLQISLALLVSNLQPANADGIQKLNGERLDAVAKAMAEPSKAFKSPPFSGSKILEDDFVLVGQYKWAILFATEKIYKRPIDGKDYVFIPMTIVIDRDYLKENEFLDFVNAKKPKEEMFHGGFLHYSGRRTKDSTNVAIESLVAVPTDEETSAKWPSISRGVAVNIMMEAANGALRLVIKANTNGLVIDKDILNHSKDTSNTK